MQRFHLPHDTDAAALQEIVRGSRRVVLGPPANLRVIYLDTFDWRLHRAGLVLMEERGRGRRLVLLDRGSDPYAVKVQRTPLTANDLPMGHMTDRVKSLLGIRVLVPVGETRVERRDGRIEDPEGDMVSLLRLEAVELPTTPGDAEAPALSTIAVSDPRVVSSGLEAAPDHDLITAAAAVGRQPGDYSSKLDIQLSERQPATEAMSVILLDLLDSVEANVDGTIRDLDTEFLHDLRVACRRTRSALTQLKGVLPTSLTAPFNAQFKWLGGVTGPLRDLHVFKLEIPIYRSMLPGSLVGDLEPLERLLDDECRRAHRSVVRALSSPRFEELIASWRHTLETLEPTTHDGDGTTAGQLATERIGKAWRRIIKRGRKLGEDPPAEAVHRLRIDAKKLRYLLEFFKCLYPKKEIGARIKELKGLQDILGGFNDMEVQRDRLTDFAIALHADPSIPASSILTMGRLAAMLEERQEQYRLGFSNAFSTFTGPDVRAAYGRLFGGKESS